VARTNFVELAVSAIMGRAVRNRRTTLDLNYVGVKAPQFSFSRLKGADPVTGVEMASTGEVACLGEDVHEAYLKAILATGFTLPKKNVLLTVGGEESKGRFLGPAQTLARLGYRIFATEKTSAYLRENGVPNIRLFKVHERRGPNIRDYVAGRKLDLVISIPNPAKRVEYNSAYRLRRLAVDYSIPILTNLQAADLFVQALAAKKPADLQIKHWAEYE
jgi:carbamoyl-phosphate synthase large subunit